jgi:hypothetical protein
MAQIGSATGLPIVRTVELLDWASGGPMPAALAQKVMRAMMRMVQGRTPIFMPVTLSSRVFH